MKIISSIVLILTLSISVISCKNDAETPEVKTFEIADSKKEKQLNPDATFAKAEFKIEGMTCAIGCAAKIEKSLANMDGVKNAKVDFEKKLATVEYDVATVSSETLTKRVNDAGDYEVDDFKTLK